MATLVMATDHYKHTLNKNCGLQGQSMQVWKVQTTAVADLDAA